MGGLGCPSVGGQVEFRVLGPLEVRVGNRLLGLGGPRRRALLAILLLNANQVMSIDRLIDGVWGQDVPATAIAQVQAAVSALRRTLGRDGLIVTRAPGYLIRVQPGELDLQVFEQHASEASEALACDRAEQAAETFRAALDLWRGPALAGVPGPAAQAEAARLAERRLAVLEQRIDADLAAGRHRDLIAELSTLVDEHPLRERLRGQLMLALYRAGRQADALAVYRKAGRALADELGLDPGAQLQRLHRSILIGDLALDPPVDLSTVTPAAVIRPAQLPADIADFTGRAKQADVVRDLLVSRPAGQDGPSPVVVSEIGRAHV